MTIQELIDALIQARDHADRGIDIVVRISPITYRPVEDVVVGVASGHVYLRLDGAGEGT